MGGGKHGLEALSPREAEVLELIAKGLVNAEIAGLLGISDHTAKAHVASILRKLEVSNRTEAVGLLVASRPGPGQLTRAEAAIAVLPFWHGEQALATRQAADGIADDLITRLGRRWFPVIARCSSFNVSAAERRDARAVGEALRAQFLLEGDFRSIGSRLRLNVRLIEAASAQIVWADTYACAATELFDVQHELTAAVVTAVGRAVVKHVAHEAARHPAPELEPWQIAVRGMWHLWKGTRKANLAARTFFERALDRAPDLRLALYGVALTHQRDVVEQWDTDPVAATDTLCRVAERYLESHPDDAWAQLVSAYGAIYRGQSVAARGFVEHALVREPSSLRSRSLYGQLLAMDGQRDTAVEQIEIALRLSPRSPERWTYECAIALAHFGVEDYDQCVHWAEQAARSESAGGLPYGALASSHAHLGNKEEAAAAVHELQRRSPTFSAARFQTMLASTRPDIAQRYLEGLQKAGT